MPYHTRECLSPTGQCDFTLSIISDLALMDITNHTISQFYHYLFKVIVWDFFLYAFGNYIYFGTLVLLNVISFKHFQEMLSLIFTLSKKSYSTVIFSNHFPDNFMQCLELLLVYATSTVQKCKKIMSFLTRHSLRLTQLIETLILLYFTLQGIGEFMSNDLLNMINILKII